MENRYKICYRSSSLEHFVDDGYGIVAYQQDKWTYINHSNFFIDEIYGSIDSHWNSKIDLINFILSDAYNYDKGYECIDFWLLDRSNRKIEDIRIPLIENLSLI